MRVDPRRMKSASRAIEAAGGKGWLADRLVQIVGQGKKAFDTVHTELGRMLAEAIMLMDREVCKELSADIERRGMVLSKKIIWVTDGGKGIIKALKDRYGEKLLHVRCMIHYLEHSAIRSEWRHSRRSLYEPSCRVRITACRLQGREKVEEARGGSPRPLVSGSEAGPTPECL